MTCNNISEDKILMEVNNILNSLNRVEPKLYNDSTKKSYRISDETDSIA